ncbi:MAG: hypothetical protein JXR95_06095 [Deltaproteobacteria bacterium]|nr:hypothetical protein [Deltaproteobacteria bacterium]
MKKLLSTLILLCLFFGCDDSDNREELFVPEWNDINISAVYPTTVLATSEVVITGGVFPDSSFGVIELTIEGSFTTGSGNHQFSYSEIVERTSYDSLLWKLTPSAIDVITQENNTGMIEGIIRVDAISSRTGVRYSSNQFTISLNFVSSLTPELSGVNTSGVEFLENPIELTAANLCVDEKECSAVAVLNGCFLASSMTGDCSTNGFSVSNVEIPLVDISPVDRTGGKLNFPVEIFGVHPGNFQGEVFLRNYTTSTEYFDSNSISLDIELLENSLGYISTDETSLGGYISITGDGFAPQGDICGTQIRFDGSFVSDISNESTDVTVLFVPDIISSTSARIVLEENSGLGDFIDLRNDRGSLAGEFFSEVCCSGSCVSGTPLEADIYIDNLKQIVELDFQDSYVGTLTMMGLQRLDAEIRARALETIDSIYTGINVEVRLEKVLDYALYSRVEIHGADPNGLNLLGYDNTVGKDTGNLRLHDVLGGVNSQTQEDGYPGYGGVFLESYFGFSQHPPDGIYKLEMANELFDKIFDELRPDRGGESVTISEVSEFIPSMDGYECLLNSPTRRQTVSCAVYILGTMLGGTIAHELGHSFGLAEPASETIFHNPGDEPLRLMDSGAMRSFEERSGLSIDGLERFCRQNYDYLKTIMNKSDIQDPISSRPGC